MLLGWLGTSTANLLLAKSGSNNGSSEGDSTVGWLWSWFSSDEQGQAAAGGKKCQATAADEVLARSCVAALKGEPVLGVLG